jgi:putative molybdopterin biosynthesis protein
MQTHMKKIERVNSFDQIKSLSDPKRLAILQMLMNQPRTISQIGRALGEYPAGIRYHIQKLEQVQMVELSEVKISSGYSEKYYSAKSRAFLLQRMILPLSDQEAIIFMGSHDLAFDKLISDFEKINSDTTILSMPVGSLDGLVALRQGMAHLSGCHLYDPDTRLYNQPYIKHILPDQQIKMITLAHRTQGLIIKRGNPKQVSGLPDLIRQDLTFINRNRGSGTRIWLDTKLKEFGINPEMMIGYTKELNSHTGIAQAIKRGPADIGIGLIAAAVVEKLDFIPLFDEQYDIVIPGEQIEDPAIREILDYISSAGYRQSINSLEGYGSEKTGTFLDV